MDNYSTYFEKAKDYYKKSWWSKKWLKNAVLKGKITQAEYEEITGDNDIATE